MWKPSKASLELGSSRRWGGGEPTDRPIPPPPPGKPRSSHDYSSRTAYDDEGRGHHRDSYDSGSRSGRGEGRDSLREREEPRGRSTGYDPRDVRVDSRADSRYDSSRTAYSQDDGKRGRYDDGSRRSYERSPPSHSSQPSSRWDSTTAPASYRAQDTAYSPTYAGTADSNGGERKRRSRWGAEKADVALPTAITGGVASKDLETYAIQLRLDEIARALHSGLVVPPDNGARSPSPEPTYDSRGRRTNTREVRYRKKLEDERIRLIDRQIKLDPSYRPPSDYVQAKKSSKAQEKVYIPVKEFPEINFFGLLCGPRGLTLKGMEKDSGAKISIRGKGSVKEGKGRPGGHFDEDEHEEMHCLVTGDSEEKVQKCVKLINKVIETAASVPEAQNDHKRSQLRELAALNGTLRDDENQACQNCGGLGHRKFECPETRNYTANVICHVCGSAGHFARDCIAKRGRPGLGPTPQFARVDPGRAQQFDSEYASLMAEIGESTNAPPVSSIVSSGEGGTTPLTSAPWNAPVVEQALDEKGNKIPPWRNRAYWPEWKVPELPTNPRPRPIERQAYSGGLPGYSYYPSVGSFGAQLQYPAYSAGYHY